MTGVTDEPGITLVCCGLLGTIVTDDGLIERSFAEAIATQGVVSGTSAFAHRMAQVHQVRGQAPGDVLGTLFPDNEARAQAALMAFERAITDAVRRAEIQPLPGAHQMLDELAGAGLRICVTTSLPRRAMDMVLDAASLRSRVDVVLSTDDVPRGFPAPDLVLTAVMRSGTRAVQDVAAVYGTGAGVTGGLRSGASLVAGVLTGPHPDARLRAAGATHILDSVADVPALLLSGNEHGTGDSTSAARGGSGRQALPRQPGQAGQVAASPPGRQTLALRQTPELAARARGYLR